MKRIFQLKKAEMNYDVSAFYWTWRLNRKSNQIIFRFLIHFIGRFRFDSNSFDFFLFSLSPFVRYSFLFIYRTSSWSRFSNEIVKWDTYKEIDVECMFAGFPFIELLRLWLILILILRFVSCFDLETVGKKDAFQWENLQSFLTVK